jgi:glycosyltransferase 2 family protein
MADQPSVSNRNSVDPKSVARRTAIKLITLGISIALLYLLYRAIDVKAVMQVLRQADLSWLIVSVGLIVPITVVRAMRFRWVMPSGAVSGIWEATQLVLVAAAFNVFLPAKSGDFAKSLIVARRRSATAGLAVAAVVYERLSDVLGMVVWAVVGVVLVRPVTTLIPPNFWTALAILGLVCAGLVLSETTAVWLSSRIHRLVSGARWSKVRAIADGWPALLVSLRGRRLWLAAFSTGLWLLQLTQIWLFTVTLHASIPFAVCASLSAIALMVAQLPISLAGLGARDIALVLLLSPYMRPEEAAAVGILTASRNLLPPLAALPFLPRHLGIVARGRAVKSKSAA